MSTYTVTTGNDTTAYTVSTGARGPKGDDGGVGTTEDVLGLLQGTAADPTRIGAEYMPASVVLINPTASIVVDPSGTDTDRGTALVAAYAAAKLLTPNGAARSESNRACVIIPPGRYYLASEMAIDTNYIDLMAIVPQQPKPPVDDEEYNVALLDLANYQPQITEIYSDSQTDHVLIQTAADVRMDGFTIASLATARAGRKHSLFISIDTAEANEKSQYNRLYLYSRKVAIGVTTGGVQTTVSAVGFSLHANGTWRNCSSNGFSFRLSSTANAVFSAKMYDCVIGTYSISGDVANGSMSGARFERVIPAGTYNGKNGYLFASCSDFGHPIDDTCVFIECDGGYKSYGIGKTCAGTFIRCRGGWGCFGSTTLPPFSVGSFTGYAEDCVAERGSFGGCTGSQTLGKCSGTLVRCTITDGQRPMRLEGATIRDSRIETPSNYDVIQLLDSNSTISNTDIITLQPSLGAPINAASAMNVAVYNCRMNNATAFPTGLGANVTNLVATPNNVVSDSVS